jgi:hypothetical protein|tara:strand:- start:286 stop:495 length:210 start_codon:yes stop_codon:yes gene_type:complete
MNYTDHRSFSALGKIYIAHIDMAKANAENLFENPMAIWEHSDLVIELHKYIEEISSNYETLKTYFGGQK